MKFVEDRSAGYGVRLFVNEEKAAGRRGPGHALPWAASVRQVGTVRTGGIEYVDVRYGPGPFARMRFVGREAEKILREVQQNRSDAGGGRS